MEEINGMSDNALLAALKAGDVRAYNTLFMKYYKLCCVNAYFYLKDKEEAKEVVQAFFVDLLEKKGYMQLEGDIKGYLYRSIKNRCLNWIRAAAREVKRAELVAGVEQYSDTAEDHRGKEKMYDQLQEAFSMLSMQRKEALKLVYVKEKRYQEAADQMGISINSLKTHLRIGLKKLREALTNPIKD